MSKPSIFSRINSAVRGGGNQGQLAGNKIDFTSNAHVYGQTHIKDAEGKHHFN
jgi:hypothetical protein